MVAKAFGGAILETLGATAGSFRRAVNRTNIGMVSISRSNGSSLAGLVRDTIARDPSPPRGIGFKVVLGAVLRTAVASFSLIFALVLLVSGLGFAATAKSGVVWIIAGFFLLAGCAVLAVPFLYARRVTRALRTGLVAEATVIRLTRRERPGRRSLEAMENGFASGVRVVRHPLGDVEERFSYAGAGASTAREGEKMIVLVAPDRRAVLMNVSIGD
jgi:hypothetical protein